MAGEPGEKARSRSPGSIDGSSSPGAGQTPSPCDSASTTSIAGSAKGPSYPGYKAAECNGCGLCCLAVPCSISLQYDLWRDGRCRALRFDRGRYWCDAIINPRRVSVRLSKASKADRIDAIGSGHGCDHRLAHSIDDALRLLAMRNILDEVTGNPVDTYPRGTVFHRDDGTVWEIAIWQRDTEPTIRQIVDGLAVGKPEKLTPAWPDE